MTPTETEDNIPKYIENITDNLVHHAERGEIDDVERIIRMIENESLRKTASISSQEILASQGYEFALNQAKEEAERDGWGPKSEVYALNARKIANKKQDDLMFWKAVTTSWKLKILYAKEKQSEKKSY